MLWLLRVCRCLLSVLVVRCLLFGLRRQRFVACCAEFVGLCALCVACCLLFVDCRVSYVVCCLLCVVCC